MNVNQYQRLALRTVNYNTTTSERLLDGLMGLNGEAGECIDILKKHLFQGHELDVEHLIEELGDVAWYLALASEALGYPLEAVFKLNIKKLKARYPDGFDQEKSVKRA